MLAIGMSSPACLPGIASATGLSAGSVIKNSAAATYIDPNHPADIQNVVSNTVSMTVAEVSGITVTPISATDSVTGHSIVAGETVNYDYLVTNTGNDPTRFVLPGTANMTGPATVSSVQISLDNGNTFTNVAAAGMTTGSIAASGSVRVRVVAVISAAATAGQTITVVLGNTGSNDNTAGTQNQAYPTAPSGNDVYTSDNPDGTPGETAGSPVNGEREASASQTVTVVSYTQSFAAVYLTHTNYSNSGTPNTLTDDVLTYSLAIGVNSSAPSGSLGYTPADLTSTALSLDGLTGNKVLISTAIPALTTLTGTPTSASGWTPVYTVTPLAVAANFALWTSTPPASMALVTRIGYVAAGPITRGSNISGFTFSVMTTGAVTGTTIAALSQLFGQTSGGGASLVYDESGDQMPSNFNDDGSAGSNVPTLGVANPTTDGTDTNNNNTGTGSAGEDNIYALTTPLSVQNGPTGQPAATGPTSSDDDFTNRSAICPAGLVPGATFDPAPVTFVNSVANPGGLLISSLLLVPVPPATPANLPTGTVVNITYLTSTATYIYNGTSFALTSGVAIDIVNLAALATVPYTVTVDLPAGTPLSTDIGRGFPVAIRAFVDANNNGIYDTGEVENMTIDRVYTGFLKLAKQAQIVDTDGTTIIQAYSAAPTTANIRPGRFIDYLITYQNISEAPVGSGNVTMTSNTVVVTDNGTVMPNNWATDIDGRGIIATSNVVGSATDSSGGTIVYYSGSLGTTPAIDQTGLTVSADVACYIDAVNGSVAPGVSGTFKFRRKIN